MRRSHNPRFLQLVHDAAGTIITDGKLTLNERCGTLLVNNNETGCIFPVAEVAQLLKAKKSRALLHTDAVQAVVIVPNRELALQSAEVMGRFGQHIRTVCCYGGRPAMDEHRVIRQVAPHVVFGTPGRLNDHFDKGNLSPYTARFLVIDEFDKCLEMGFHNEMAKLLKRLSGVRRRFLLSATNTDRIPDFVNARHVAKVDYSEGGISSRVEQYCLKSADKDKLEALGNLLCTIGRQSSMVFLNYRDSVERVASYLRGRGFGVSAFHGGLEQPEREAALYRFGNGSANVLVSTDLASRGLDIPDVDNIIHYHMPLTRESYIHRVGRTARWDATGKSFFILSPDESLPDFVEKECSPITLPEQMPGVPQPKMETLYIGKGKKDKISKGDIVGFLCKKGGLDSSAIGRIDVRERYCYVAVSREKVGQVLSMAGGEKIKGIKTIVEVVR